MTSDDEALPTDYASSEEPQVISSDRSAPEDQTDDLEASENVGDENTGDEDAGDEDVGDADSAFHDQQVDPPLPAFARTHFSGPATGLRRAGPDGFEVVDGMAGRCSPFGFGLASLKDDLAERIQHDWGTAPQTPSDGGSPGGDKLLQTLMAGSAAASTSSFELATVYPAAELAIESAITAVRMRSSGQRYRMIAIVGSDHGRTGVGRTASGQPQLRQGYGPLMSGFDHVAANDLDQLADRISEQTGAVMLSPIELHHAAKPLDESYLSGVSQLCDQHDLLLVVDESQLGFGGTAMGWSTPALADVPVDLAILSAGLFGGLPGGLLLAGPRAATHVDLNFSESPFGRCVAQTVLDRWAEHQGAVDVDETARTIATSIAQTIAGFEFVRDIHCLGGSVGIETDLGSASLIEICDHFGLRVQSAGETAIRMTLPLAAESIEFDRMLERLSHVFEAAEKYQPVPM